ncbi:MAG: nucleotide pyrophosphohydrolase [Candidatus Melainabacteria bacterium]|nr:nucleotide pyrophosphohydrolase [Candidatus Melainabacteria bacterium]
MPLEKTINRISEFVSERDWSQFHNSKDLALALSIEAAELNELFLWKGTEGADPIKLKEELADIFIYALLLTEKHNLNIEDIILEKLEKNSDKYPINRAKGKSDKYTELI